MKTATNPSGTTVYFDETHHKYFVGDVVLTPVTTFVESFFPKFDAQDIAEKFAKKHGRRVNDVLAEWEDARIKGEELGNAVHEYAWALIEDSPEALDYASELFDAHEQYRPNFQEVNKAIVKMSGRFEILEAEKIIFSLSQNLAGTMDLIARDIKNGQLVIFDWKTNRKIESENLWENALDPVAHLEDCEMNRYTLQLNSYEYILRAEGYYPEDSYRRALIHVQEDKVVWHKIKDRQMEIKKMVSWI